MLYVLLMNLDWKDMVQGMPRSLNLALQQKGGTRSS